MKRLNPLRITRRGWNGQKRSLGCLGEDQIEFLKGFVESEKARADRLQEELLGLAKTHAQTLERHAADMRLMGERRVSWWRRWAS
jgi:hypothetical protein